MKAKLFIVLAAVAMLFTACGKDKTYKNELTWNGETRQLISIVQIRDNGTEYYISGSTDLEEGHDHPEYDFDCEIDNNCLNKTFDLTAGNVSDQNGYCIWANRFYSPDNHWFYNKYCQLFGNECNGHINGEPYENTSIFKSGTMTITLEDEGIVLSLDGVLKNNDTFTVDLYIPKADFIQR